MNTINVPMKRGHFVPDVRAKRPHMTVEEEECPSFARINVAHRWEEVGGRQKRCTFCHALRRGKWATNATS